MSVTKQAKAVLVRDFARSAADTGSVEVQVALLSDRIKNLTVHLQKHPKDVATRRGLTGLVAQRGRLLKYLGQSDSQRYGALVARLGLRG